MTIIQKRGETYQFTILRMFNGKNYRIRKGGFLTKAEARVAAAETEEQINKETKPYLKYAPFEDRNAGLRGIVAANKNYLTIKERELLVKEIHKRLDKDSGYYVLLLAATIKLRFLEIIGLTIEDFDFNSNTIMINKIGVDNIRMQQTFGLTVNQRSPQRLVEVDECTMKPFKKLFQSMDSNKHGLVFYNSNSTYKLFSEAKANKLLENMLIDLGIDPITVRELRYTGMKRKSIMTLG